MACLNFKKGLKMAFGPIEVKWKNSLLFSTGLSYTGVHVWVKFVWACICTNTSSTYINTILDNILCR